MPLGLMDFGILRMPMHELTDCKAGGMYYDG